MAESSVGLYQQPQFYNLLFKRNYAAEGDFLEECLRRHGSSKERSMLELGCGPAHNSRDFSKRGYRSVAFDLEPQMLKYAQAEADRDGVSLELVQGNLIEFDLARPVALAICMWDTLRLVLTNEDMVRHLRAVSRNLLPGGVYVIETGHPRLCMEPYSGEPLRGRFGDIEIEMTWGLPQDPYDSINQVHLTTIRTATRRNGEVIAQSEEKVPQRFYLLQEMRALIELAGAFSEVHYYGRSDLPLVPLHAGEECNGTLIVLVKAS